MRHLGGEEVEVEDATDQFNLGAMLFIALGSVIGTTLTVWALHFMHLTAAPVSVKPLPHIAVLPFRSLSTSPADALADQELTAAVINRLTRVSRVESLSSETDADPVAVGKELGVKLLLMGTVERQGATVRVNVQLVSATDAKQLWTGVFAANSSNFAKLSGEIDRAVAPHLTALLD